MLYKHFPKDIVYIDADAVFKSYPLLFDKFEQDIGVVVYRNYETFSGTIYLANNHRVHKLVDDWQEYCFKYPGFLEQLMLEKALVENKHLLSVMNLPFSYCKVFDDPVVFAPVIEQYQASRKFKADIEKK
jgi:hypothetical protein